MAANTGLLSGLNKKRLWIGMIALAFYVMFSDFIIHGPLLGKLYMDSASSWRPEAEMNQLFPLMFVGQFLTGALFLLIFAKGYQKGGWIEGVRFGLVMWAFLLGGKLIQFVVSPIPQNVMIAWAFTDLFQTTLGGVLASWVYGRKG